MMIVQAGLAACAEDTLGGLVPISLRRELLIIEMDMPHQASLHTYKLEKTNQQGFTLIELMIVVVILAIIASIAIPSYRAQVRQNAEEQAKTRALAISNELSSWRSKKLSYAGFVPRNSCAGSEEFCYSIEGEGKVYVPLGSDATSHRYLITLVDAPQAGGLTQVAKAVPLNSTSGVSGKGWRMLVVPNSSDSLVKSAHAYYLDSLGQRCRYDSGATLPVLAAAEISCTGTGVSSW